MENQFFRELIRLPRKKFVSQKDIAVSSHIYNEAMYLVSEGSYKFDSNQYKPEDFLMEDEIPESIRLKQVYRKFKKD